jgi:hypothetical protein
MQRNAAARDGLIRSRKLTKRPMSAIVVLTAVPPNLRPTTDAPHDIEFAAAFLITGILFSLAYAGRERILSVGAVIFCAIIEILQLYVPGRHARRG